MNMHSVFLVFLLLGVCLEISLVYCKHKHTTKITIASSKIITKGPHRTTTLSIPAYCNETECEAKGKEYCLCPKLNYRNLSSNWPVPKKDTCSSIGCLLDGQKCECGIIDHSCECYGNKCNKTECDKQSLSRGCYCYIENKAIMTVYMPASKKCSNLLKEIGNHNGRYQCSGFSCKCDEYGDCVCKPPKNKNPLIPKPKECNSDHCGKRSFEFCHCTYSKCSHGKCSNDVVFKKLPKSGICSGLLTSYECINVGQKCSCKTNCEETQNKYKGNTTKKSECVCNDVVQQYTSSDCNDCKSSGSCICTYGEFAVEINNAPENCSALEKSQVPNSKKFDACPYREGGVCECKQDPNTHKKQCFCLENSVRIPPFTLRPNPHACCNTDNDCIEHNEVYCYCTNRVNNTYVKQVSRSAIEMVTNKEFDNHGYEKLCYAYGHPPDISCHTFGYFAICKRGFCNLDEINLYYSNY